MTQRVRRSRWWRWAFPALALCVVSFAAGAYLALVLATADLDNWGSWARDFAKSPGAAAFAALVAAAIAFVGISRQVAVSRSTLDHQRRAADTTAWWETFEWASGRALPSRQDDRPLPDSVTISTLQSLVQAATTDVQKIACAGVIDVLTSRVVPDFDDIEDTDSPERDGSAAVSALVSYVEASDGTTAASAKAEAAIYDPHEEAAMYERRVLSALSQLSSDVRVFREPGISSSRVDAVAEVAGKPVAVEVSFARTPLVVRARVRRSAQRRQDRTVKPLVLVSRFESPFAPEEEAGMRSVVTQWNTPEDNEALLEALRYASTL